MATGKWRGGGNQCCLKAAGYQNFLVASGVPYFDAGSEPADNTMLVQAKEFLTQ
jgi:hypothetical protein